MEDKKETVDAISQYDVENDKEEGPEAKKAWKIPQMKSRKKNYVPMLMVVGKNIFVEF